MRRFMDPGAAPTIGNGPGLVARMDADANRILLPPHVRALPWEQQVEWARARNMRPVENDEAKARTFLERAKLILQGSRQRYSFAEGLRAASSWFEMMQPWMVTDGVQVAAANVETVLTQDTIFTLPANFFSFPGKTAWFHIMGVQSNVVTTPGNVTFRLRWNAIGGTILVASGAITPDPVAATNNLFFVDLFIKCLAMGQTTTALTLLAYGEVTLANAAYTLANSKAQMMPPGQTAVANVASLDGTVGKALTVTVQPTLATFTLTARDAWIVALN